MFLVQGNFILDLLLVAIEFLRRIKIVPAAFRDTEMLDICNFFSLSDTEVGGIGLFRFQNVIGINLFVGIINLI